MTPNSISPTFLPVFRRWPGWPPGLWKQITLCSLFPPKLSSASPTGLSPVALSESSAPPLFFNFPWISFSLSHLPGDRFASPSSALSWASTLSSQCRYLRQEFLLLPLTYLWSFLWQKVFIFKVSSLINRLPSRLHPTNLFTFYPVLLFTLCSVLHHLNSFGITSSKGICKQYVSSSHLTTSLSHPQERENSLPVLHNNIPGASLEYHQRNSKTERPASVPPNKISMISMMAWVASAPHYDSYYTGVTAEPLTYGWCIWQKYMCPAATVLNNTV